MSLKTGFAQIFSRCPKNLSCPKFGGAAAPLAPPARTPMQGPKHGIISLLYREIFILRCNFRVHNLFIKISFYRLVLGWTRINFLLNRIPF